MGKSVHAGVDNLWDFNRHTAVFKAADSLDDNLIRAALGIVFMELDMGGPFDVAARIGGNQRCLVAVSHFYQTLLDTLHVHTHGINGTGDQYGLGGHKVTGMGYAVTYEHFQAGAAHSHQVDALGPGIFGGLDQGRFSHRFHHGLKQVGLMAVDDDIDLVFL